MGLSRLAKRKTLAALESWIIVFRRNRKKVAERTGLEPATPGVTGRYSNQLNYRSESSFLLRSVQQELGGCYRSRTCDLRLVRAPLYQLS